MSDDRAPRGPGKTPGPVMIDLDAPQGAAPNPAEAAPVPDADALPMGTAMQSVAALTAKRPSRLVRFFFAAVASLLGAIISIAAWDYVTSLLAARPVLGFVIVALMGVVLILLVLIALREAAAFGRLRKIDDFQRRADAALSSKDLSGARDLSRDLSAFYQGRSDTAWGRDALSKSTEEAFDADAVLARTERHLLAPLDERAQREIEAAARQVATVTALVPLALADVVVALTANLRMIRRIAEVYGGRAGTLGAWRLTRAVMTHLVATGAVAVGDDLLEPILGGSILGKVSRRFGEGMVNGALTARVGVAAMEVCRPLPFASQTRPRVRGLVQRALTGLVMRDKDGEP